VVVGGDLVDLEQSELMMPKKSWHATRLQGPPGVPLPPDRQRHEESDFFGGGVQDVILDNHPPIMGFLSPIIYTNH